MPNIAKWAAAGLDAIHVAARSSAGFMAGYSNLVAANTNMGSGMRRVKGAVTAPIAIPEPTRVPVRGDNGRITTFQFQSDEDNAFTLENSVTDIELEMYAQGGNTYVLGEWDFGLRGSLSPTFKDLMFLLTRNAESQEAGSQGTAGFENMLVLDSSAMPLGDDQWAYQEEGSARLSCLANPSLLLPWGVLCSSAFTLTDGITIVWKSQYRTMLHVFIGDGTEDEIVVDYTPINVAKSKCFNADTAAAITVSTVTPGTKTIALAAPVPINKYGVLLYECAGF